MKRQRYLSYAVDGRGHEPALAENPRRNCRHREIECCRIKIKAMNYRVGERSEMLKRLDASTGRKPQRAL